MTSPHYMLQLRCDDVPTVLEPETLAELADKLVALLFPTWTRPHPGHALLTCLVLESEAGNDGDDSTDAAFWG